VGSGVPARWWWGWRHERAGVRVAGAGAAKGTFRWAGSVVGLPDRRRREEILFEGAGAPAGRRACAGDM